MFEVPEEETPIENEVAFITLTRQVTLSVKEIAAAYYALTFAGKKEFIYALMEYGAFQDGTYETMLLDLQDQERGDGICNNQL